MTSIGDSAFDGADIPTVITLIVNPFSIGNNVFSHNTYKNAMLIVPKGTINKYRATEGWSNFLFIEESDNHTPEKCSKPSISYSNGQLKFYCHTEGVEFKSSIKDSDIKEYSTDKINLSTTYNISVYATKTGYEDSDVASATLCWIDAKPMQAGTIEAEDAVVEVKAMPVLIQTDGSRSHESTEKRRNCSIYATKNRQYCHFLGDKQC